MPGTARAGIQTKTKSNSNSEPTPSIHSPQQSDRSSANYRHKYPDSHIRFTPPVVQALIESHDSSLDASSHRLHERHHTQATHYLTIYGGATTFIESEKPGVNVRANLIFPNLNNSTLTLNCSFRRDSNNHGTSLSTSRPCCFQVSAGSCPDRR